MKTIIFVCHGNICRSVAAEYIAKQLLIKYHLDDRFNVISRATSTEEIGNDIYPPMKRALYNKEIPFNKRNLLYQLNDYKKIIFPITMYIPHLSQIDDPWYTGQFDEVVNELEECIENIIQRIK